MEETIKCSLCSKELSGINYLCEVCSNSFCGVCIAEGINNISVCKICEAVVSSDDFGNAIAINDYYIHCNHLVYRNDNNEIIGCQNKECLNYKMYI